MNPTKTPPRKRTVYMALGAAALLGASALSGPVIEYARADNLTNQVTRQHAPSEGFADIVEKVMPAVVSVKVESHDKVASASDDGDQGIPGMPNIPKDSPLFDFFKNMPQFRDQQRSPGQERVGLGSGFIISADGYVVTNNHVVDKADTVVVTTTDGKEYSGKVVGTDPKTDLAVIKIEGDHNFSYVTFAKEEARVGDWVVAVGNPFGLGGTVTTGIISARGREIGAGPYDDFLQIDAPINRGNSGGPSFNLKGEVVGVNSAIYSPSGGSVGIGFAIPSSLATNVVESLIKNGEVTRGWLGVAIQPVNQEIADSIGAKSTQGALVTQVTADSPASKAGFKTGDMIVSVDGEPVKNPRDLSRKIAGIEPGEKAELGVLRSGKEETITVAIAAMQAEKQMASAEPQDPEKGTSLSSLGLSVAPSDDGDGVTITSVDPAGKAARTGLQQGDRIVEAAGATIKSPADLRKTIDGVSKEKKSVLMLVRRGDNQMFVAIPITKS
ncbi:serine protease Do [Rhodoligotrophos appendicifer]|uniref:Do family serine endopeptidase n=1 Tax=Rhodoligotrophos appendicifer TaxID=987056 RepID=UPI00118541CA|nr:Do family serine endopeptidase [Rhodoligotrophos appendicifer]